MQRHRNNDGGPSMTRSNYRAEQQSTTTHHGRSKRMAGYVHGRHLIVQAARQRSEPQPPNPRRRRSIGLLQALPAPAPSHKLR